MTIAGLTPKELGKRLYREYADDDVSGLAAEMAYRTFLALFPFMIFLAAVGGFAADIFNVENPTQQVIDRFGDNLPADARSVLEGQVGDVIEERNAGLLSAGILGTIWAASAAVGTLVKALNRTHDVPETRPYWKRVAMNVGMTIGAGVLIILAFATVVTTQMWGENIAEWLGMSAAFETFLYIARWPLLIAVLLLAVAFLYWAAPNITLPFKYITAGSLLFAVTWVIATTAFGLYVAGFTSYNATYGALGGVVVLLLWFYLSILVMLMGAELNSILDEANDPEGVRERREKVTKAFAERGGVRAVDTPLSDIERHSGGSSGKTAGRQADGKQPAGPAARGGGGMSSVGTILGVILAAFAIRRAPR